MHYVDTSALVKLVVREEHSRAMRQWAVDRPGLITADLTRTELMRAVVRVRPEQAPTVRAVLDALETVGVTRHAFDEAGRLAPPELRSLDAIHLAVALSFGDDLEGVVTYDDRLAAASIAAGIAVVTPRD